MMIIHSIIYIIANQLVITVDYINSSLSLLKTTMLLQMQLYLHYLTVVVVVDGVVGAVGVVDVNYYFKFFFLFNFFEY